VGGGGGGWGRGGGGGVSQELVPIETKEEPAPPILGATWGKDTKKYMPEGWKRIFRVEKWEGGEAKRERGR